MRILDALILKEAHIAENTGNSISQEVSRFPSSSSSQNKMKKSFLVQITTCLVILHSVFARNRCIETSTGPIKGTEVEYQGAKVQVFLSIPFAEPPVGDLRFKKPVPKRRWLEPLQATKLTPQCPQYIAHNYPWIDQFVDQSEDCLYLNIWVPPNTCKKSKKAVMFWIFGGSFAVGSAQLPMYDGRVLAAKEDVIVVTVNYRLDILGFLSLGTEEAPGNMGLYDILEALKWVNWNIGAFGGDSGRITVFGDSAGGIASGLMCLSPLTKGLMQRAILQSGSAAFIQGDNIQSNNRLALKVAKAVGCAADEDEDIVNPGRVIRCLRSKSAQQLVELTTKLNTEILGFFPIVGDEFIPVQPKTQLLNGSFRDTDIMIGNVQDEGSFILPKVYVDILGVYGEKNGLLNKTAGANSILTVLRDCPRKETVVQYYLGDLEDDDYRHIREQSYHATGDYMLFCTSMYNAETFAKKGLNVYAYYFNHVPSVTPWAPWMGSVHYDDVPFVFGRPLDNAWLYSLEDQFLSRRMIKLWSNFAKTGRPENRWKTYSRSRPFFKVFNVQNRDSYLEEHQKNCEFFRPLLGYL